MLLIAHRATAETVTTAPSSSQGVNILFEQLAHADAATRENARQKLLQLSSEQLPEVLAALKHHAPLLPAQLSAVREVVPHLFLRGLKYEASVDAGFLGVKFAQSYDPLQPIVVESRIPGFVAFAQLRDGDIILGTVHQGRVRPMRINDNPSFAQIIRASPPGQDLQLEIQRANRVLRVTLRIDARPIMQGAPGLDQEGVALTAICNARLRKAELFWRDHVAPLLANDPS